MSIIYGFFIAVAGLLALLFIFQMLVGFVIINERQVGVVVKKFSAKKLIPGRLVALEGEAGYQADTLAPGLHLGFRRWQFLVHKVPVTVIPPGTIGLVVAADGAAIPSGRILAQVVECDDFQDARKFLVNGGEKGRQLGIITAGTYRINTALFTVISVTNASQHGIAPDDLMVYEVEPDMVGIVTTLDGQPIEEGEIAGRVVPEHSNFQNAQSFLARGGRRGLQEQVLLSGSWNLNPWFVQVEQVPMTEIPIGYVGVVISYVGEAPVDVTGLTFTHTDLVDPGHKGVWVKPLYPGKHPMNSRVMRIELVPTTNIVLNWASRIEDHQYDSKLEVIRVNSKDGFTFGIEVAQIIHVGALDAPRVISRVGSMQNLVDHVLEPIVSNYFRNAAQAYTVLDFLNARQERQGEAAEHVSAAIRAYDVQAIDTLIGEIVPPPTLMETLTERKIAEEQRTTYERQKEAQEKRQELVRETALADIQQEMVSAEQGVNIAELEAKATIQKATGDAESTRLRASGDADAIRATGEATAEAYTAGVTALGADEYTRLQVMQVVGENNVRIIPEVWVGGGGEGGSTVDGLLGMLLMDKIAEHQNGRKKPTKTAE